LSLICGRPPGKMHSVREFIELSFAYLGMEGYLIKERMPREIERNIASLISFLV